MADQKRDGSQELPQDQDHPYDNPDLSPLLFMLAVMRDPTVDISHRILAAERAAPYVAPRIAETRWEDLAPEDRLIIRIYGLGSNELPPIGHA